MYNFPAIPEFANSPTEVSAALRAIKQCMELLAGLRQGQSKGAPCMYIEPTRPLDSLRALYNVGDLWINTTTNKLNYWTGNDWKELA